MRYFTIFQDKLHSVNIQDEPNRSKISENFQNHPYGRLCIKVGRGRRDGDIGTRVWGLGTWGRETRDLGTSSTGRGDAGTSKTGTQGTRDVNDYRKSRR